MAQTAAPPAKPECGVRPQYPGALATDKQKNNWRTDIKTYVECYKQYVLAKREWAQEAMKAANEAVDAFNAAAKEIEREAKEE